MRTHSVYTKEQRALITSKMQELLSCTDRLKAEKSRERVIKAFEFADNAHYGILRKTGDEIPYIIHPIEVATIVAKEMGFGSVTIAAALLHDTVEDTGTTIEEIEELFGKDIAVIVDGVTKITGVYNPERSDQAETFRDLILKMSKDKRIAFVKIADRLHNLRTMEGIRENSQMIKTGESLDVYAPLAYKLGLFNIKQEIEDLSFKYRQPRDYNTIKNIVDQSEEQRREIFRVMSAPLSEMLKNIGYDFSLIPVTKSLFETWYIMQKHKIAFEDIHNYMSVRLIFKNLMFYTEKMQAFMIYASISDLFNVKDLRDWITEPRSNGFESLMTDVLLGNWIEVQIMSERMHHIAQIGYAADHENLHQKNFDKWLRSTGKKISNDNLTNEEIMELLHPDEREIDVFTDTGVIVSLKRKSTALDFAFHIHKDLGMKFKYALIGNKAVQVDYELKEGDRVKIITGENITVEKNWVDFAVTAKAKSTIRRYFNKMQREYIGQGKQIFNGIIQLYPLADNDLSILKKTFNCPDTDVFYKRIALKEIPEEQIVSYFKKRKQTTVERVIMGIFGGSKNSDDKQFYDFGDKDFSKIKFVVNSPEQFEFASCCNALPGDESIAYRATDGSITVHKRHCKEALELNSSEGKNTSVVHWQIPKTYTFPAAIFFEGSDRRALLSEIIEIISEKMSINMTALNIETRLNYFSGIIKFQIPDAGTLEKVIKEISKLSDIRKVYRV